MDAKSGISGCFQLQQGEFKLDMQFAVPGRGVTAVFGASGSGKTSLIRCIAGLERAPVGELYVNSQCWQDESRRFFLPTYERPLGYVFQEASLFAHLTVQRNLEYGFKRIAAEQRRVQFDEAVELLGIRPLLTRYPARLSGGERQRVAIARALLTSPRLLLMDEPLAALDMGSKADILPYLERLHTELSLPVLYITHALHEVMRLADHMLLVQNGRILSSGAVQSVLTRLDLAFNQSNDAGVMIQGQVAGHDERFHLTYVDFAGGRLSLCRAQVQIGSPVRVSILARDVSLALQPEENSSILNEFLCTISDIVEDAQCRLLVKLDVQGASLLARISRKSGHLLGLQPGTLVYARVKSVALL